MVLLPMHRPPGNTVPAASFTNFATMAKSRNWCFTLNNPTGNEDFSHAQLKMLIANKEIGEQGTVHYQGYTEWLNPIPLTTCRNLLPTAHWEVRKGTQSQAILYCLKDYLDQQTQSPEVIYQDETLAGLEQFGLLTVGIEKEQKLLDYISTLSTKKQSKLLNLKRLIDEGVQEKDLWDEDFETMVRHHRALNSYRLVKVTPRSHPMEVIVIFGPTGTGKSRWCAENYPNAYWKQLGKWWDGYQGHEAVIIDEFYGWLQWTTLLRLCDRYPMMLETKGGQLQFTAKTIVFTSNTEPHLWYKDKYFDAFKRRVTTWIHMHNSAISQTYNTLMFDNYKDFTNSINNCVYIAQI